MKEAAKSLFESLKTYREVNKLLDNGEAEGQYLECKINSGSRVGQGTQAHLATAISGFSNADGGVLIYGVSATKIESSGLDLLTEIVPIANVNSFFKEISNKIPTLTSPNINFEIKILKKKKKENRGIVLIFIPKTKGDPIQSLKDQHFYFRSGDEFNKAPHEMIKRLFAASESPDLHVVIGVDDVKLHNGSFEVRLGIQNESSAIGEHVVVQTSVINADRCESVNVRGMRDISDINPGIRIFSVNLSGVVHRGIKVLIGTIILKMKGKGKRIQFNTTVFANKMLPRVKTISIVLNRQKPKIKDENEKSLYV